MRADRVPALVGRGLALPSAAYAIGGAVGALTPLTRPERQKGRLLSGLCTRRRTPAPCDIAEEGTGARCVGVRLESDGGDGPGVPPRLTLAPISMSSKPPALVWRGCSGGRRWVVSRDEAVLAVR